MPNSIEVLQQKREELLDEIRSLKEFRRGTISTNYRKCGKPSCHCNDEGAKGHGPQYLWNATISGKSVAKNLQLGAEVEKYVEETDRYKKFISLSEQLVEVNEQLCERKPVKQLSDEKELEELKKKLQKQLSRKQPKR